MVLISDGNSEIGAQVWSYGSRRSESIEEGSLHRDRSIDALIAKYIMVHGTYIRWYFRNMCAGVE